MMHLVISPAADDDLTAIWRYIGVEKGNVEAAINILESIRDTLLLLPRFPQLGRSCTEFEDYVPNLKSLAVEGYVIYYRLTDDGIDVGRVVNARRERERIVMRWPVDEGKQDPSGDTEQPE